MPETFTRMGPYKNFTSEGPDGEVLDHWEVTCLVLQVKALGTDDCYHYAHCEMGPTTTEEFFGPAYDTLENLLKHRMIKQGVWGA